MTFPTEKCLYIHHFSPCRSGLSLRQNPAVKGTPPIIIIIIRKYRYIYIISVFSVPTRVILQFDEITFMDGKICALISGFLRLQPELTAGSVDIRTELTAYRCRDSCIFQTAPYLLCTFSARGQKPGLADFI